MISTIHVFLESHLPFSLIFKSFSDTPFSFCYLTNNSIQQTFVEHLLCARHCAGGGDKYRDEKSLTAPLLKKLSLG